ncbi:MAG: hypothetical protein R3F61_23050 [Myxococcota bacterium]
MFVVLLISCSMPPSASASLPEARPGVPFESLGHAPPDRMVLVDLEPWGDRGAMGVFYSLDEVLRPIQKSELSDESEVSVAVRLVLSEVGPDRLVTNEYGLKEAVGILETVFNRLDPIETNPLGIDGAPEFPGCGPDGVFRTCADPDEYLGLKTWRAFEPDRIAPPEVVEAAADLAVTAWWLVEQGRTNVSRGATSYVHRCGGSAYGEPTWRCSRAVPGASPHSGPVMFKSPGEFDRARGFYRLSSTRWIDYEVAMDPTPPLVVALR